MWLLYSQDFPKFESQKFIKSSFLSLFIILTSSHSIETTGIEIILSSIETRAPGILRDELLIDWKLELFL